MCLFQGLAVGVTKRQLMNRDTNEIEERLTGFYIACLSMESLLTRLGG